jgi:1,4-dihydroxy-2-naphthoate octaprenyltransferase
MPRRASTMLLFNHLDAWVVAMAIVVTALVVHARLGWETLPLLLAIGGAYWLAFAVNDYFDAPADSLDAGKARGNYFAQAGGRPVWFWVAAAVLVGVIAVVLARYGWMGGFILAVGVLVAWSYSAPPLRLKERPGLDVVTHAVFVESYPYMAVLLLLGAAWSALDVFILTVLFLSSLSAQLEQQLRDFDLDRRMGRTFATAAGRRPTYVLLVAATAVLLVGAGLYYLSGGVPLFLVPYGFIPLPALLHRLWRGPNRPRSPWLVTLTALAGLAYTIWLVIRHWPPGAGS